MSHSKLWPGTWVFSFLTHKRNSSGPFSSKDSTVFSSAWWVDWTRPVVLNLWELMKTMNYNPREVHICTERITHNFMGSWTPIKQPQSSHRSRQPCQLSQSLHRLWFTQWHWFYEVAKFFHSFFRVSTSPLLPSLAGSRSSLPWDPISPQAPGPCQTVAVTQSPGPDLFSTVSL